MIELNRELLITTYGEVKLLSLTKIELGYKNITKIDSSAFKGLTKLEEIDLHRNRITEIDANCFSDLSNLKVLELSNNSLTKIDSNAFNGLKKLERLQLDENFLEEIDSTLFEPLSNLRTLSIDKNKLKTINSSTFKRLPKFHTLSLTGNEIEEIDTSLFESLSNLVYLRLGENKLKRIDENTFKNLSNLEVLTLGGDKSTVINSNHFQNISRYLRVLCLDRFKLRKIDANLFKGLKFLEVLSLDECGIEEIESNAFDDIRTLILTNNLLVRIDSDLFKRSANLEEISLSGNEIEKIDQKAFEKLSKLKKLRLGDNRLKGIDREWFDDLKSIEVVELYGNDLDFCSFLSPDSYEIGFQQLLKTYEFVSDWNLFLQHLEERNRDGGNADRLEMEAARKRVAEEGETIRQLEFEKELELLDSKESDQIDLDHENDSEFESLKPSSRKRNKVKALFRACFPIKHDIKEEENDNKIEDSDEFKVGIDEIEEIKEEKDPYIGKTIYDRYEIVDKLGQFGSVYLVNDLSNIGNNKFKQKAMKVMNDFNTEIQMFLKIHHENIVEYFHSFTVFWTLIDSTTKNEWSQFGSNMDKTILITEYCENGDLKSKIDEAKRLKRGFNESDLLEWMSQAANALKFLHSQKPKPIIHRNIKPSNLLLTRRNEIKLSDLGFSDSNENDSAYMSLEVLASQFMDIKCYPNVDIWSLGCVLYELVFLKCAFPEGLYFDPPIPSNLVISGRFSNILPKMLEKDRLKRISSKRLFAELEKLISK